MRETPTARVGALPDDIRARVYNQAAAQNALTLAEEVVDQVQCPAPIAREE